MFEVSLKNFFFSQYVTDSRIDRLFDFALAQQYEMQNAKMHR